MLCENVLRNQRRESGVRDLQQTELLEHEVLHMLNNILAACGNTKNITAYGLPLQLGDRHATQRASLM